MRGSGNVLSCSQARSRSSRWLPVAMTPEVGIAGDLSMRHASAASTESSAQLSPGDGVLTACRILSGMRSFGWMTASVLAAVAAVGVAAPAEAAPAYPKAAGRCVDQTAVLGRALCKEVTAVLLRDEKSTTDEIAVAVVPTTGGAGIEAWSTGLFDTWGVGKKGKNGVLLVVALDDHKVRLQTGRGVANRLGDSDAAHIVDDVTSYFTQNEYPLGILTGLDDVRRQLGHHVPADALLVPLAARAPAPTEPELSGGDDAAVSADGSDFTTQDDVTSAYDSAVPVLPIAIGGFAVVALLGVAIGRGSSRSTGGGDPSSFARHNSMRQTTWTAGSTDSTTINSSPSLDSSGGSAPGFGTSSTDGSGATGTW